MTDKAPALLEVAVIGAGFSGICAGIKLRQAGITDFTLLEQAEDIGGVWHWNTYPDVAVDIPVWGYSFSFERNPNWEYAYARGHEIKAYADRCVDKYGVRPHVRLNTEVVRAAWDDAGHFWRLDTTQGPVHARFIIISYGGLGRPKYPDIEGLDSFKGPVIHSARWDHTLDMQGQRVGVIGTGSSAVQIIPATAEIAEQVHVFQRTPIWVLPKPDFPLPRLLRFGYRMLPFLMFIPRWIAVFWLEVFYNAVFRYKIPASVKMLESVIMSALRRGVPDPVTRAKLTPNYRMACKFPSMSSTYYKTFARENVNLVTTDIAAITETGVQTVDGDHHEIDMLVLATGFETLDATNLPRFKTTGRGGQDLRELILADRKGQYEGLTLPKMPNNFTVPGLYAMTGSFFVTIESSVDHVVRCILEARRRQATAVEIKAEPFATYVQEMIGRQYKTLFYRSNCERTHSWYFDENGDVPLFRPTSTAEAAWRVRHSPLEDYTFRSLGDAALEDAALGDTGTDLRDRSAS
ncbi:NAD(P)/FAD-dependent oxidoreductase [Nocardia sp. NPDC006630]|uniref:flavin-containing monooxygenase n=1 Tax=Nocardia sp. NPDC006630 TaxID=3157181 RepID=UPI0033B9C453